MGVSANTVCGIVRDLISKANTRIERLVEAYANEEDDDLRSAYLAQQKNASRDKKALTTEEAGLVLKLSKTVISEDKRRLIIDMAKQFADKMEKPSTVQEKRVLLDMLNVKIEFFRDTEYYLSVSWAFGTPEKIQIEEKSKHVQKVHGWGQQANRDCQVESRPVSTHQ